MPENNMRQATQEKPVEESFDSICGQALHPKAIRGIELFNAGHYWEAHEALEEAWLAEAGPARHLYKGILQAGVMYLQIERGNFIGMAKMYERSKKWLAPWPDQCRGINIEKLRSDIDDAIKHAGELGPDRLEDFDKALLKKLDLAT